MTRRRKNEIDELDDCLRVLMNPYRTAKDVAKVALHSLAMGGDPTDLVLEEGKRLMEMKAMG